MGHIEFIVESPKQHAVPVIQVMQEYPGKLFRQYVFLYAVMVVQPRLGAPADMEGAVDMTFRPLHDLAEFVPVVHLFKLHEFDRRTGDDHSVVIIIPDLIEGLVEGQHMFLRNIVRLVGAGLQQLHLHLQRGISQQPCELCFSLDLRRHQVQ